LFCDSVFQKEYIVNPLVFYFTLDFDDDTSATYGFVGTPIVVEKLFDKAKSEWGVSNNITSFGEISSDFYLTSIQKTIGSLDRWMNGSL
jgi:hypothetical protein